jgi:putative FmdB family regulatory protein
MPCYTFFCDACTAELETFQRVADPSPVCPACGANTRRMISGSPAFSLKGTGWAADAYSVTDRGAQSVSDRADRKGSIKSFASQKNKGRA